MVKDDDLLEKYKKISQNSASASKKNLIVNMYMVKTTQKLKIKTYRKTNANFQNNNIQKVRS